MLKPKGCRVADWHGQLHSSRALPPAMGTNSKTQRSRRNRCAITARPVDHQLDRRVEILLDQAGPQVAGPHTEFVVPGRTESRTCPARRRDRRQGVGVVDRVASACVCVDEVADRLPEGLATQLDSAPRGDRELARQPSRTTQPRPSRDDDGELGRRGRTPSPSHPSGRGETPEHGRAGRAPRRRPPDAETVSWLPGLPSPCRSNRGLPSPWMRIWLIMTSGSVPRRCQA